MKKLMAAALAAITAPLFPAHAEMTVTSQLRFRSEIQDGTDATLSQYRGFSLIRMRPTFTFKGSGERRFVFEPQFAQAMGALNGATVTSGTSSDPVLGVHQAHAILPAGSFEFRVGRQVLSYGDELVVGALEWSVVGRAFDAFRVRYAEPGSKGFTDLFASVLAETGQAAESEGDMDLYGLYHSVSPGDADGAYDLYVLRYVDSRGAGLPADLWTGGARAKSDLGAFDYRVEATYQSGTFSGERRTAYQADGEIGADAAGGRVYAGGFVASAEYRQLFPTAHKWLGTADVLGRRNLIGPRAGMSVPAGDLRISLDLHYFSRADGDAPAYALDGATAVGSASSSDSRGVGTEADLAFAYPVDEGLTLAGGASMMFPGPYLRDQFGAEKPVFGFAQLDFRF